MLRLSRLILLAVWLAAFWNAAAAQAADPGIMVLQVKGTINPVPVDYLQRSLDQAERDQAVAVIIQLDTPGGLDTAMRDIVQTISNSRVPVVVYVSPAGARAASAGVFITMAAHVAAMAPGTAIGAAHPVSIGTSGETQVSDEMQQKILNDAVAYIRSLAEAHGRNADWAEDAVKKSVSITEQEALHLNVIDLVAPDINALVQQLDGRPVTMLDGQVITLNTSGATLDYVKMNGIESILYAIADPNIAYLLLSLASLGILVEVFNPGLIFPGVIGAISGLLAFYALGMLPVNLAGVLLIVLAFGLFIAEAFTASFGLLTAGGATSLIIGSLILFKGRSPLFQVSPWLIAFVTIIIVLIFVFVISRVVQAHRRRPSTGREELAGKTATVRVALAPVGTVLFKGELWTAVSEAGRIEPGEEVIITRVDGLKLRVTKKG
ncbi:MAG: nodulation protein NfeD [Chloroflexota bacterium]